MGAKVTFPSLKSLVDRSGTWSKDSISRDRLETTNPRHTINTRSVQDSLIFRDGDPKVVIGQVGAPFLMFDPSPATMSRETSSLSITDESYKDDVTFLQLRYQRPRRDRVYCKECSDHPQGFRGEHELKRHQDRQHEKIIKKWVCIHPVGLDHPTPAQPLSGCKPCSQKKYLSCYNAAAHLRHAHFRPRATGRGKSGKLDEANTRAGNGGGDFLPMAELRHWMLEVEEPAIDYMLPDSQQEEDDTLEDEGAGEISPLTFDTKRLMMSVSEVPLLSWSEFEEPLNAHTYPTNDLYSMESMEYHDFFQHGSPQSIDPEITSGQGTISLRGTTENSPHMGWQISRSFGNYEPPNQDTISLRGTTETSSNISFGEFFSQDDHPTGHDHFIF